MKHLTSGMDQGRRTIPQQGTSSFIFTTTVNMRFETSPAIALHNARIPPLKRDVRTQ